MHFPCGSNFSGLRMCPIRISSLFYRSISVKKCFVQSHIAIDIRCLNYFMYVEWLDMYIPATLKVPSFESMRSLFSSGDYIKYFVYRDSIKAPSDLKDNRVRNMCNWTNILWISNKYSMLWFKMVAVDDRHHMEHVWFSTSWPVRRCAGRW